MAMLFTLASVINPPSSEDVCPGQRLETHCHCSDHTSRTSGMRAHASTHGQYIYALHPHSDKHLRDLFRRPSPEHYKAIGVQSLPNCANYKSSFFFITLAKWILRNTLFHCWPITQSLLHQTLDFEWVEIYSYDLYKNFIKYDSFY